MPGAKEASSALTYSLRRRVLFSRFRSQKGLASRLLWLVWVRFGFWLIYSQD